MKTLFRLVLVGGIIIMSVQGVSADNDFQKERQQMVAVIQQLIMATKFHTGENVLDDQVKQAMLSVPRHEFVPEDIKHHAYENSALPIEHKQTISQPYIVALMTQLAEVSADSVVLEVGTGSGYQAAVLSKLVSHVYSIEIVEPLGLQAESRLQELGYDNVTVRIGDGYFGWPEYAPFDAILVTAAAEHVPQQLLQQLKPGGRLIIPVGEQRRSQSLKVLMKGEDGNIEQRDVLPVAFVPLTGEH